MHQIAPRWYGIVITCLALIGTQAPSWSSEVAATPQFSHQRGFYDEPISVTMSSATPGATIRYALGGADPHDASPIYTSPIIVDTTTVVRARAFAEGMEPSRIQTHTYIYLQDVIRQPRDIPGYITALHGSTSGLTNAHHHEMNQAVVNDPAYSDEIIDGMQQIPSLVISVAPSVINDSGGFYRQSQNANPRAENLVSVEVLYPDDPGASEQGYALAKGHSWSRTKRSIRFNFSASGGGDNRLDTRLLQRGPVHGATAPDEVKHLVLRAGSNRSWAQNWIPDETSYTIDQWQRDHQTAMSGYGVHGHFVHLYINGIYWGLYNAVERGRDSWGRSHFGGSRGDWHARNHSGVMGSSNPDASRWNHLRNQVVSRNRDLSDPANMAELDEYLDVEGFFDYLTVQWYGGVSDWPYNNWLANNRVGDDPGPVRFLCWDLEWSWGKPKPTQWTPSWARPNSPRPGMVQSMMVASRDLAGLNPSSHDITPAKLWDELKRHPDVLMRFADRAYRNFFNDGPMTTEHQLARWNALNHSIRSAVIGESARWGDHLVGIDDNVLRTRDGTFDSTVAMIAHWVQHSVHPDSGQASQGPLVDTYIASLRAEGFYPSIDPPRLAQGGTPVEVQFLVLSAPGTLAITNPNGTGTIHWRIDGQDPRQLGGTQRPGNTSGGSIAVGHSCVIKARVLDGSTWSAMRVLEVIVEQDQDFSDLQITEIHYEPLRDGHQGFEHPRHNEFEFLELKNTGSNPLDLSLCAFNDGIHYTFPVGTIIAPGGFIVLTRAADLFVERYGVEADGQFDGALSNSGEPLGLVDPQGTEILSVTYGVELPWPQGARGNGFSLVPDEQSPVSDPNDPAYWRSSTEIHGSPFADDPLPPEILPVYVNEVLAHTDLPQMDAIELHNPNAEPVDVAHWWITDDVSNPKRYRIPADRSLIPAGGYLVFTEADFAEGQDPFAFSSEGEDAYLFSGDADGHLTGYVHGFSFGASANGVSFGRYITSIGAEHFPAQRALTFGGSFPHGPFAGADNAGPLVGPVVISEIMYNSGDDNVPDWLEVLNISDETVFFDNGLDPWQLGGIAYVFPMGVALAPGEALVLTEADPATFRSLYTLPDTVQVLQYPGNISNNGERLRLRRPDNRNGDFTPYIDVDVIHYEVSAPWPTDANQTGRSIERIDPTAYGDDPINWASSTAVGGTPGTVDGFEPGGDLPTVGLTSPADGTAFGGEPDITISATASAAEGRSITVVEFFANGIKIGEASSAPYNMLWSAVPGGNYTLTARAIDDSGAIGNSSSVMISVATLSMPYGGTPRAIPGRIQVQDFDVGGPGIAYHDTTASNQGSWDGRPGEHVDLGDLSGHATESDGVANLGWTQPDEWLHYTVTIAEEGVYDLDVRNASANSSSGNRRIRFEIAGEDLTGTIDLPHTGDWNAYVTTTVTGIELPAGTHRLRLHIVGGHSNINWFEFRQGEVGGDRTIRLRNIGDHRWIREPDQAGAAEGPDEVFEGLDGTGDHRFRAEPVAGPEGAG